MFSRRTAHDPEPNALARAVERARADGRVRADLTGTNPTALGLGPDRATIDAALAGLPLDRYEPDPRGSRASRAAFGARLGVDAERILLTASTSEGYAFVLAILADPGDLVLVPRPSYPLLEWLARLSGVALVPYDLVYDGEWHVDRGSIDRGVAARAKAVIAISPNNPTGSYLTDEDRAFLGALGPPLVLDEVFHEHPLDRADAPGRVRADEGLVFRLTGLSKLAAMPQAKVGCVAVEGEPALVREALARLELVADSFLSLSTAADLATPAILAASDAVRARIRARCRQNLATLDEALRGSAATRLRAEGGWSVIVRLPAIASEDAFVLALLEAGVVVQPGWFYDLTGGPFVVLSLLGEEDELRIGAQALAELADGL